MAGHLARNQVHAGSIPAALTMWGVRRGGATPCTRRRTGSTPVLSTFSGSVLLGEQSVSKADEQRSNRC
jgi:hypothetical protein